MRRETAVAAIGCSILVLALILILAWLLTPERIR